MFLQRSREDEIAAFLNDLRGGPDFRQKFISVLSRMTEDEWAILEKKVLELAQEFQKEKEAKQQEADAERRQTCTWKAIALKKDRMHQSRL